MDEIAENTQEELDAAFEAGLKGAGGNVVVDVLETADEQGAEEEQELEETGGDDSPVQPDTESVEEALTEFGLPASKVKELLAKVTEIDDIKAQFQSETQKIYGKFGEVQKRMQAPQQGRKLSKDDFKSMQDAGYDDLVDAIATDLTHMQLVSGYNPEPIVNEFNQILAKKDAIYAKQLEDLEMRLNASFLAMEHPDWSEKWESPDMKLWMSTQPHEKQEAIKTSKSGVFVASAMDEFVAWRDRGKTRKNERLERAVTPRGAPPSPKSRQSSESEAFNNGVKAAQRRLGIIR